MKRIFKYLEKEWVQYVLLWLLAFLVPIILMSVDSLTRTDVKFSLSTALQSMVVLIPFLIIFLIHNYFGIRKLLNRKHYIAYVVLMVVLAFSYGVYHEWSWYSKGRTNKIGFVQGPPEMAQNQSVPDEMPKPDEMREDRQHRQGPPPPYKDDKDERMRKEMNEGPMVHPILVSLIQAFLVMGLNLAISYAHRLHESRENIDRLEKQSLRQELDFLKYQINPHFFMNTLNNIHMLVDIDAEKAKQSIVELSRLMRYVLYDGAQPTVDISKEVDFIMQYISLMKMRYIDKVKIETDFDLKGRAVQISPLLFISFVENAFKHGVSYKYKSYIKVRLTIEGDFIQFYCMNSKPRKLKEESSESQGGVGLENARKRLDLLYKNHYWLNVEDSEKNFIVELKLPIKND